MRFDYQYRTRENELRTGSLAASSREEAFSILKSQGIHPSRVNLAPGFLNRLAALGKRGWAIVILALVLALTLAFLLSDRSHPRPAADIDPEVLSRLQKSGLDVEAINDLLKARQKINEDYRRKIEADVSRGKLTRRAADELLSAAGL